MKFKVGDKIKGLKNGFTFTSEDMMIGIVEDIWIHPISKEEWIDVRVIKHKDISINGKLYPTKNKSEYFKIIK